MESVRMAGTLRLAASIGVLELEDVVRERLVGGGTFCVASSNSVLSFSAAVLEKPDRVRREGGEGRRGRGRLEGTRGE